MYKDPNKVIVTFPLIGGGRIDFGYAVYDGGMSVGTSPLMGRITVTEGWGHYPDGWFRIGKQCGVIKLKSVLKENDDNFLPDWLRADCYEYHYYLLKDKS